MVNYYSYPVDFPSEEILRKGFEALSRTEGFENLAMSDDPLAREYAVFNGFDRLSPRIIARLKNDGCNFVRLAVEAMEMETKLIRIIADKAATMLCPGKVFSNPLTGEAFNNLPLIFFKLYKSLQKCIIQT
ncbi:MAG: hypothetical protein WC468_03505 [Candidatus Paceibacterota bacterium]